MAERAAGASRSVRMAAGVCRVHRERIAVGKGAGVRSQPTATSPAQDVSGRVARNTRQARSRVRRELFMGLTVTRPAPLRGCLCVFLAIDPGAKAPGYIPLPLRGYLRCHLAAGRTSSWAAAEWAIWVWAGSKRIFEFPRRIAGFVARFSHGFAIG